MGPDMKNLHLAAASIQYLFFFSSCVPSLSLVKFRPNLTVAIPPLPRSRCTLPPRSQHALRSLGRLVSSQSHRSGGCAIAWTTLLVSIPSASNDLLTVLLRGPYGIIMPQACLYLSCRHNGSFRFTSPCCPVPSVKRTGSPCA